MNTRNYQSEAGLFATLLGLGSFALGTLLLLLRLLLPANDRIVKAGFYYVVFVAAAHAFALLLLLYCCIVRAEHRDYYGRKIFLLLCNIPVAGLYTYIAFEIIH
jgi:hypothetical protein